LKPLEVANFATVWVVTYRVGDQLNFFLERKWEHPNPRIDGRLCLIGGNWFDPEAAVDRSFFDTGIRELWEELTFDREHFPYATPMSDAVVREKDREDLLYVVREIPRNSRPLGVFLLRDEESDAPPGLVAYFDSRLDRDASGMLMRLQKRFGNLSGETQTVITTIDEMVETEDTFAFGHDRPFQIIALSMGLEAAVSLNLADGYSAERLPWEMEQLVISAPYSEATKHFNPQRRP